MKKCVTVQDLSCIGKCSAGAALPVLSAMGIETAVLPTALLSTHTAFKDPAIYDLTAEMKKILQHWEREQFRFDAVCSGYLRSVEQVQLVRKLFREFTAPGALRSVDPAMADHGRLYSGFDTAHVKAVISLCREADLILPNLSEACLIAGIPYPGSFNDEPKDDVNSAFVMELLQDPALAIARYVVITGVSSAPDRIGAVCLNTETNKVSLYEQRRAPVSFSGTGDLFAAVMTGAMLRGLTPERSMQLAVDYTSRSIENTLSEPSHNWYGVNFERTLPWLIHSLENAADNNS